VSLRPNPRKGRGPILQPFGVWARHAFSQKTNGRSVRCTDFWIIIAYHNVSSTDFICGHVCLLTQPAGHVRATWNLTLRRDTASKHIGFFFSLVSFEVLGHLSLITCISDLWWKKVRNTHVGLYFITLCLFASVDF